MEHGFLRTAAATPVIKVADTEYNADSIISLIEEAGADGVKLMVFPELCITGYTCSDLFFQRPLLDGARSALARIEKAVIRAGLTAVVGLPLVHENKLYNCAAVICPDGLAAIVPKTNLPNYSEYYEARQFTPAPDEESAIMLLGKEVPFGTGLVFECTDMPGYTFGAEICEDLWVPESPSVYLAGSGANIILNLSAGDEIIGKADYRRMMVKSQSGRLVCAYVYAGAGDGESTTDVVFSGHRLICENGSLLNESRLFTSGLTVTDIDTEKLAGERIRMNTFPTAPYCRRIYFSQDTELKNFTREIKKHPFIPHEDRMDDDLSLILDIQSAGLKKRILHTNVKTALIGISGGLDSTLALICAVRAMDSLSRPRTDVIAVTMPCFGTTKRTKSNAERLCEKLGVSFKDVNISESVLSHFKDIGQPSDKYDVTFENAQARERTQVLMDIANMTGGMVIGTGDLSELALGWATYNGDHMSMYGVNASIPKTLVRHLVRYYADTADDAELKATLYDILDTPVSPELLPAENGEISQKTEGIVGPYELHDFFLYYMMRFGFAPKKILFLAERAFGGDYEAGEIKRWLGIFIRRFFNQQFKRSCVPDGTKVGSVALSPRGDWRMPSDACAALWSRDLE